MQFQFTVRRVELYSTSTFPHLVLYIFYNMKNIKYVSCANNVLLSLLYFLFRDIEQQIVVLPAELLLFFIAGVNKITFFTFK